MKLGIRKRGTSWEYYFRVKKRDGSYKTVSKSGFKTKPEAEKSGYLRMDEVEREGITEKKDMTLQEFYEFWKESIAPVKYAYGTQRSYCGAFEKMIPERIKKKNIKKIDSYEFQVLFTKLIAKEKPSMVQYAKCALASIFKYAKVHRFVIHNPVSDIEVKVPKPKKKKLPTMDLVHQLDAYFEGTIYQLLYQILKYTGLRSGEAIGLTWDDVNFEDSLLHITKQLKKTHGGRALGSLKSQSSERVIHMPEVLKKALLEAYDKHLKLKERFGSAGYNPLNFVSLNSKGNPLIYNNFRQKITKFNHRNNTDFQAHDLRRLHATLLLDNGVSIAAVRDRLGHSTIEMSLSYTRTTPEMQALLIETIDNSLPQNVASPVTNEE